jgi:outer membrane protein TolC
MRAQSELVAAKSDVRRIELDLQDRLALAYRRYADAKQQTSRYNDSILGKARKSLDLVKDGYEEGQSDYLSLITAQQTFVRVNLAYLESLKELRTSLVIIEGQLLTGSLSR